MWDLWWVKWHWSRCNSEHLGSYVQNIITPLFYTCMLSGAVTIDCTINGPNLYITSALGKAI
jgi:hypothetical protein